MSNLNVTRRDLVKDAALGAAAVGIFAGASTALADEATEVKNSSSWVKATQNVTWDEEHDIVICGYGMAGTTAYVEAIESTRTATSPSTIPPIPSTPAARPWLRASA